MRVAVAQINPIIGDFQGNADRILYYLRQAAEQKADLAVFPEMCVCGYPPMDLLDHESFIEGNLKAVGRIQREAPPGLAFIVGYVEKHTASGRGLQNVAVLIQNTEVLLKQAKTLLPSYDVFDETRYFEPSDRRRVISFKGQRLGLAICEDIWWEADPVYSQLYPVDPVRELLDQGATLIVSPSASPYYVGKPDIRLRLLSKIGKSSSAAVVYVNTVGGNDSLVFDGQSMVTDRNGQLIFLGAPFTEQLSVVRMDERSPTVDFNPDPMAEIEAALVLGLKDYVEKCGFERVHVGLSGGIDSALVTTLAVKALGSQRVTAFSLPSRYSSEGSKTDAQALADRLGIQLERLPIEVVFDASLETLKSLFQGKEEGLAEENLQARIRGLLLMAYANKFHSLLLATGNKSELATGYCTLYGDMCGGLAVIGDLLKTEVYALARHLNREQETIPETILTKAPSAELKPDQTDQDSLPPYDLLDQVLDAFLIRARSPQQIVAQGFDQEMVNHILYLVERAEYKRRQAPPVLKVSSRAFGTGRRIPIARKY